jgi:hypothetical protein
MGNSNAASAKRYKALEKMGVELRGLSGKIISEKVARDASGRFGGAGLPAFG